MNLESIEPLEAAPILRAPTGHRCRRPLHACKRSTMNEIGYLFIVAATFVLIYQPPILPINVLHPLAAAAWMAILLNWNSMAPLLRSARYPRDLLALSAIAAFLILTVLINGSSNYLVGYETLVMATELLPISLVAVFYLRAVGHGGQFAQLLVHVGLLQTSIAFAALLYPAVQDWIVARFLDYGYRPIIAELADFRIYGFSNTLTYAMPITQAVIAIVALRIGLQKHTRYLTYAVLIAVSGIINARVALVVLLIGIFFVGTSLPTASNALKSRFAAFVFVCAIAYQPITHVMRDRWRDSFSWIEDGSGEILSILGGGAGGYYFDYVLNPEMWTVPDGLHLLIGTGDRVMRGSIYQSDVGYINDLWLGGLIYAIIAYSYLTMKLMSVRSPMSIVWKRFVVFLLVVLMVVNVKGIVFSVNEFMAIVLLCVTYISTIPRARPESRTTGFDSIE